MLVLVYLSSSWSMAGWLAAAAQCSGVVPRLSRQRRSQLRDGEYTPEKCPEFTIDALNCKYFFSSKNNCFKYIKSLKTNTPSCNTNISLCHMVELVYGTQVLNYTTVCVCVYVRRVGCVRGDAWDL